MRLLIVLVVFFISFSEAFAYYRAWSPFKEGAYRSLDLRPVADKDIPSFIRDHSDLDEDEDIKFDEVYKVSLTGHGQEDFVVLHTEPSLFLNVVDLYLKTGQGFRRISYGSCAVDTRDFIIADDGRPGIVISSVYWSHGHNYMTYSVYQIQGSKLVNADKEFDLPKFILMTDKPNHRDTRRLTSKERQEHTETMNRSIQYEDLSLP